MAPELSQTFLQTLPRAFWAVRMEMRRSFDGQLTVPEYRVLGHLMVHAMSNKELAELQGVSVPAMSRMVANLRRRGLISGEAVKTDRRQVRLQVSRKGQELFSKAKKRAAKAFEARFRDLDRAERKALLAGLAVLDQLFPMAFGG